jgi:isocitrate/isopropylmalate dehydrogenase
LTTVIANESTSAWSSGTSGYSVALMLRHGLGRPDEANALEQAVDETLGEVRTADLGGTATTREVGDAVLARIGRAA